MPGTSRFSMGGLLEMCGPMLTAGIVFFLLMWFKPEILELITEKKTLSFSGLYSAVFDWASIQTGFLFAIYGFVAGKTDGFIGEIRHTRSMAKYNTYLKRAISIGFLLTLTSMPLIVIDHSVQANDKYWYWIISLWLSLFVWAFGSFARVAYIFGILVRVRDPDKVPAG